MKKQILSLLLIGTSIISYAQQQGGQAGQAGQGGAASTGTTASCNNGCIAGSTTIILGQTLTYTSTPTAQCTSCYDWDINNDPNSSDNSTVGTLKISGSDMGQTVNIQAVALGAFSIQLTYFDDAGCHPCCFSGTVVAPPPNCCSPVLGGFFQCRGGGAGNTGGQLTISTDPNCGVDWTKISKISIWLNGAAFIPATVATTTLTLTGPFTGQISESVISTGTSGCFYGNNFGASVTFSYNNGCAPVTKNITIYDYATPPTSGNRTIKRITVSPNPSSSVLRFAGEELGKYKVTITSDKGIEVVKNQRIDGEINIEAHPTGTYYYTITGENGFIQQGTLLKN